MSSEALLGEEMSIKLLLLFSSLKSGSSYMCNCLRFPNDLEELRRNVKNEFNLSAIKELIR